MSKTFRNIYFAKSLFPSGKGNLDILYYGTMYSNAKLMKDFSKLFDRTLDLFIQCDDCAKRKYRNFIKVRRP